MSREFAEQIRDTWCVMCDAVIANVQGWKPAKRTVGSLVWFKLLLSYCISYSLGPLLNGWCFIHVEEIQWNIEMNAMRNWNEIISNEKDLLQTLSAFFANAVEKLNI